MKVIIITNEMSAAQAFNLMRDTGAIMMLDYRSEAFQAATLHYVFERHYLKLNPKYFVSDTVRYIRQYMARGINGVVIAVADRGARVGDVRAAITRDWPLMEIEHVSHPLEVQPCAA
jgi:hypothetical protein